MDTNFLADIHPKVVHFPVALLTTYSILEIVGIITNKEFISRTALLILCFGVLTAFFAVLTGDQAASNFLFWTDESGALLSDHKLFATYLVWFSAIVLAFRIYLTIKKRFIGKIKFLCLIFALVILFLVAQVGLYGGDLVKKFGIGTDLYQNRDSE